ncbi:MAG: hypothetical protein GX640_06465 [Fibrobacter sp.]|nr:hypothetical protein [Fibrobacter sp.]
MTEKRNALEVHFAVSDKVNILTGKDGVSHIGFSIFDESYNCGRTEGRFEEQITSNGVYVAVKSPYRLDGFYLKLTDSDVIANSFKEFADGYLSNKLDEHGIEKPSKNTSMIIPDRLLMNLWFIKNIAALKQIPALKSLSATNRFTYDREISRQYLLLNHLSFEEFHTLRESGNDTTRCNLLKGACPVLSNMTTGDFTKLWGMDSNQINDFVDLVVELKRDLSNRMYDTFLLDNSYFDYGKYEMIGGYNCVRATFFFLDNGLKYAINKLQYDAKLKKEIESIQKLVKALQDGTLNIPWRAYRRARWHSDEYPDISFIDTPQDGIYWKDFRDEACLTNATKTEQLNMCEHRQLISDLTKKTDVTDYERQGIEYVSFDKLSEPVKEHCRQYEDFLKMLGMGSGPGPRSRFIPGDTEDFANPEKVIAFNS